MEEPISLRDFLTVKEASTYLCVSESIVRRSVKEKKIPYHRMYGKILFSKTALDEHIHSITITPIISDEDTVSIKAKKILRRIR